LLRFLYRYRTRLRPAFALTASLAMLVYGGAAHAAIYKFVDENGVTNFTNVPPNGRYKLMEKTVRGGFTPVKGYASLPNYTESERARYEREIVAAAKANNLDPALLHAVISVESGYNRFAQSNKGAAGLMQLTMDTAIRYGVTNRLDPMQNVLAGARYLRDLLVTFHNDMKLALAAYNAGEQAVVKYGNRVPPYPETIDYIPRVLTYYKRYSRALS
jgi:soluble lytic murein transglycosylase-like protein